MPETQPRLLDQYGNTVRRQELVREIAAPSLTGIRQAWAPSIAAGLTPASMASILANAEFGEGYEYLTLAEEMEERDPHYASVLGVRKRALSGIQPIVHAASDDASDQEIADKVRERIVEHDGFSDMVEDLLDGIGKGFSVVEIDWHKEAGEWWPRGWIWRTQRFFRFDRETGEQIRLQDEANLVDGVAVEPYKFICHKPRLKSGLALRGGLARLLAFSWLCKQYAHKDWISYIETYGMPLRLGKYGPEATEKDISMLVRAVANIGTDAAAIMPRNMEVAFEGQSEGAGNSVFEDFVRWVDEQVSKAVLGQTMTSDNGSSMAQANVHNEVRHDVLRADARQVAGAINRDQVRPYVDLNFGRQDDYPRIEFPVAEPEDTAELIDNVVKLVGMGLSFKAAQLRAKVGLDAPDDDDDDIIGGAPLAAAQARMQLRGTLKALSRSTQNPYASLDDIEAAAALDWEDQMLPMIDPVQRLLAEAGSLEEFRRRLPELAGEMELGPLIDHLAGALFQARGEGEQAG